MSGDVSAILRADWPAPPGVHAFTTLRHGAGVSRPPFDSFNLGPRAGDDPDAVARNRDELIERFALSDRQAEDILEIRLRQLSRLEGIKIEQEIAELGKEQAKLESLLASPARMKSLVAREIREDAKKFGDPDFPLFQELL